MLLSGNCHGRHSSSMCSVLPLHLTAVQLNPPPIGMMKAGGVKVVISRPLPELVVKVHTSWP